MYNKSKNVHWAVKAKAAKQWKEMVYYVLLQTKQIPKTPFTKATVEMIRCSSAMPDGDNVSQSFKPILDGLVEAKVLVDDSIKVISFPKYGWQKAKATEGRIIITVRGEE